MIITGMPHQLLQATNFLIIDLPSGKINKEAAHEIINIKRENSPSLTKNVSPASNAKTIDVL
jgi:hypothetical protein